MLLPFISIYTKGLTDVNYYAPALATTIVLNGLLYNIKTPQSMLIHSAGLYKETRWRATIQGAIIIVAGVLLGLMLGLPGIMLGACLSNFVRTVDLIFFVSKYVTQGKWYMSALRMMLVFANIALIILPSAFLKIAPNGYLEWVVCASIVGIYSVVVVSITTFIFSRKEFFALFKRIKNLVFRRAK